jgi:hypothetical protein
MPEGYVAVAETADDLNYWVVSNITLTDLDGVKFPDDPDP